MATLTIVACQERGIFRRACHAETRTVALRVRVKRKYIDLEQSVAYPIVWKTKGNIEEREPCLLERIGRKRGTNAGGRVAQKVAQ